MPDCVPYRIDPGHPTCMGYSRVTALLQKALAVAVAQQRLLQKIGNYKKLVATKNWLLQCMGAVSPVLL